MNNYEIGGLFIRSAEWITFIAIFVIIALEYYVLAYLRSGGWYFLLLFVQVMDIFALIYVDGSYREFMYQSGRW